MLSNIYNKLINIDYKWKTQQYITELFSVSWAIVYLCTIINKLLFPESNEDF